MLILVDWKQYFVCKDILIKFCQQFKTLPQNDYSFLVAQKEMVFKEPQLSSYFYQFLFDSAYHKKTFNNKDIMTAFENTFEIKDIYNLNGGMSDSSTLNTAFVVYKIVNNSYFKNFPITILSTPIDHKSDSYQFAKLSSIVQEQRDLSQKTTGQPNCDLLLGNRPYDIKHCTKWTTTKNIILPQTYEKIEEKGLKHLKDVFANLKKQNTDIFMLNKLEQIINEKNLTPFQKNSLWNEVLAKKLDSLPLSLSVPIIVEMTGRPYSPIISKEYRESFHIPNDIADNPYSARKAISGVLNIWNIPEYKKNAIIMTENGLPLYTDFDNSLTVD